MWLQCEPCDKVLMFLFNAFIREEAPAVRVMEFSEDGSLLAYVAENRFIFHII